MTLLFRRAAVLTVFMVSVLVAPSLEAKKGGGGGEGGPTPVSIETRKDLEFGDAAADSTTTGTITLNPVTEAKTVSGGVVDFGGKDQVAEFRITGDKNADVFVVLPTTVQIDTVGGTMTLNNFTMDAANPVNLGSKGRVEIKVGASLTLQPGQKAGNYTGGFTVSADY